MISMKRAVQFVSFFFLLVFLSPRISICSPQEELPSREKDLYFLERTLFELINEERQKHGLHLVGYSPDLSQLARKHSQDMASRGRISHASSNGKSYMERLVDEGFYFIAIGENVAFSNAFQPELIHKKLMESPGHRKNILDPNFDQAGIGAVVKKNKGYFVTQDFRRAPVRRNIRELKTEIQRDINSLRRKNRFPPLDFFSEANEYALKCSQNMEKDRPPPPMPDQFRAIQYYFIRSPALDGIQSFYRDKVLEMRYLTAGLGITFARNEKYPGGCYFITLLLLPGTQH